MLVISGLNGAPRDQGDRACAFSYLTIARPRSAAFMVSRRCVSLRDRSSAPTCSGRGRERQQARSQVIPTCSAEVRGDRSEVGGDGSSAPTCLTTARPKLRGSVSGGRPLSASTT